MWIQISVQRGILHKNLRKQTSDSGEAVRGRVG